MMNKVRGDINDYCRYYGTPCKDIKHCDISYERCAVMPASKPWQDAVPEWGVIEQQERDE